MQLDEALRQITDIRRQMCRSEVFRGYRSLTIGFSGIAGLSAAAIQPAWVASPIEDLGKYLFLWLTVAGVCLLFAAVEVFTRARRSGPGLARQHAVLASLQFLPSIAVGAILTVCIYRSDADVGWMLPGLWSLLYGMGIFASHRLLPRQVCWAGAYYILCGTACLSWGQGDNALSPWQMGISFGGGQLLSAVILYWTLERGDGTATNP